MPQFYASDSTDVSKSSSSPAFSEIIKSTWSSPPLLFTLTASRVDLCNSALRPLSLHECVRVHIPFAVPTSEEKTFLGDESDEPHSRLDLMKRVNVHLLKLTAGRQGRAVSSETLQQQQHYPDWQHLCLQSSQPTVGSLLRNSSQQRPCDLSLALR
ncbi:hypothetical protein SRHO_G00070590 [Serrasalmus rhombeus]